MTARKRVSTAAAQNLTRTLMRTLVIGEMMVMVSMLRMMMVATMLTKMEVGKKVVNKLLVGGRGVHYAKYLPYEYFEGVDFLVQTGNA